MQNLCIPNISQWIFCNIMDPFLEVKVPVSHCKKFFVGDAFMIFFIEFSYSYWIRLLKFLQ
jgi:hypothetical protein